MSKKLWFDLWQGRSIQTGSGAHPASFSLGTKESFPGIELLEHEADHLLPSSGDVKIEWSYTFIHPPPYAFMAGTRETF